MMGAQVRRARCTCRDRVTCWYRANSRSRERRPVGSFVSVMYRFNLRPRHDGCHNAMYSLPSGAGLGT